MSNIKIKLQLLGSKIAGKNWHFVNCSTYLSTAVRPDVTLGDFNEGFKNSFSNGSLFQTYNFMQKVCESTHTRGGLIDLIYVNKFFSNSHQLQAKIICVYCFDHAFIKLTSEKVVWVIISF